MSFTLTLHSDPQVPLEAEVISPDRFAGLSREEISALPLYHGNRQTALGEFFSVEGSYDGELRLRGNLSRVKMIGAGMSQGRMVIEGDVGFHLGAAMTGGEILVAGNCGDWLGPEMSGGRILVEGDAGHAVGSAYRGSRIGMRGGEIIVRGKAGNEIGNTMRGGLILIGGDSGDFTGVNMLAGTIIVLGRLGWRSGAGMRRGSIVTMEDATLLPTFTFACRYEPTFLRLYLLHLREFGVPIEDRQITGAYRRWCGDSVGLNRGEILLLESA